MLWHVLFAESGSVTSITGFCTIGSLDFRLATGYRSTPDQKLGARQLPDFILIRRSRCVVLRHAGIERRSIIAFALQTTACCGVGWPTLDLIRCFEPGTTTMQIGAGGDCSEDWRDCNRDLSCPVDISNLNVEFSVLKCLC